MAKPARYLPWVPVNLPRVVRQELAALYARIELGEALADELDAVATKAGRFGGVAGGAAQVAADRALLFRANARDAMTILPAYEGLGLHWFTPAMTAMAMALSEDYAHFWDPSQLLPSPDGLLIWEGGTGEWVLSDDVLWVADGPVFVDGFRWHVCPEGVQITPVIHTSRLRFAEEVKVGRDHKLLSKRFYESLKACALVEAGHTFLYAQDPPVAQALADYLGGHPWAYGFFAAVWASLIVLQQGPGLVSDPVVVEGRARAPRKTPAGSDPGYERTVRVRVIDVVHRARHEGATDVSDQGKRWTLKHQHMVRAHIRNQAYGPGRSLRKPILIAPYVKGPEDAPFVEGDKVHLWRTPK